MAAMAGDDCVCGSLNKQEQEQEQVDPSQKKQKIEGDEHNDDDQQQEESEEEKKRCYDSEQEDRIYNDGMRCMTVEEAQKYDGGFDALVLPDCIFAYGLGELDERSRPFQEISPVQFLPLPSLTVTKYHECFNEAFGRKQHKPRREKRRGYCEAVEEDNFYACWNFIDFEL
ncbi:hypothetical protein LOK49_LG06G01178 [Camellia lanceoleosa]|uniref:Uncharacterized protein n=1 Tax=Camellia lanceoleosa TaxID=1840588 RepID=A0ACC0HGQ5_9ERIC|nr:hypothetical protein LOK49_LG06G01178 [Camellia lanceoleosa]